MRNQCKELLTMLKKIKNLLLREYQLQVEFRDINSYFLSELNCSDIPESKYEVSLSHLNHEKKLDLKDIEEIFGADEQRAKSIQNSLKRIYYKASCDKAWDDSFIKALKADFVKTFILKNAGTNEHCDFCLSKFDQELPLTVKTLEMFHSNCKCKPYKKSFIEPVIKF
ncbi:hypothetical protein WH43_06505 [Rheinheimera sp. KL1]|uniref:hypothetical protein n=1 Tax=Rheinheimera sp. KL1 TaxID=1635005 RepID=UPI0006A9856C|nr:hypothetical protein [Rheinheimera sp. KL1]KOO58862.1 hypothetical protein WH43_06505 [Rheinheimera sp. KL1]